MEQSTLVICQNKHDVPDSTSAIVLSEVIREFDENQLNEIFKNVENVEVSHRYDVPVYDIAANHVWEAVDLHDESPQRMELLIIIYQHLVTQVTEEVDKIRCIGVSGRYLDVVHDLVANESLELEVSDVRKESITTRSIAIRSVGWLLISVLDAFISLLLRPFFSSTDAQTLLKYPVFRPKTFRPIQNHLEIDFDSVFTLLTISYFIYVRPLVDKQVEIMPIRCFSTFSSMIRSYRFFILLIYDLTFTKRTETGTVDAIESKTGFRLDHTVGQLFQRAIWSNFQAFLFYESACELCKNDNYHSALITTSGPSGKALTLSAVEHGIEIYCLPHAISNQLGNKNLPFYTGVFTEGKITGRRVEQTLTRYIPTGFPKHIRLYNKRGSLPSTDGNKTVVLATQAYADVPREFIRSLIPVLLEKTDWRIVIKIHPSEEKSEYIKHFSETQININENDRVIVADKDLHSWIVRSRLLLTINSNVGVESVILGTPAVSYNPWSPEIRDPMYAKHGPVLSLREPSDVVTLLADFNGNEERTRQEEMLDELYMVHNNSMDKVASRIQTELAASNEVT
jgi:hypothetical protein